MKKAENASRERLLEAAGEVFAERGYRAATVREITARAGMNVAAVNYHFQNKEELYAAVLKHAHRSAMESPWVDDPSAPPEERLGAFVSGMLRHLLDPTRPAWHRRLMAAEMSAPTPLLGSLIEEGFRPRALQLQEILLELTGDRLDAETLDRLGASIIGQCVFYRQNRPVIQALYPGLLSERDYLETLARHITEFSLAGIRHLRDQTPEGFSHVLL
jgi:AcrR family transcriptional regulator